MVSSRGDCEGMDEMVLWGLRRRGMATDWANQGRGKLGCSYKRTTLVICSINIVVALYVLRSLYGSLYLYSSPDSYHCKDSPVGLIFAVSGLLAVWCCCVSFLTVSFFRSAAVKYTPDQIKKMDESVRIRRAAEPVELVKLVSSHFKSSIFVPFFFFRSDGGWYWKFGEEDALWDLCTLVVPVFRFHLNSVEAMAKPFLWHCFS